MNAYDEQFSKTQQIDAILIILCEEYLKEFNTKRAVTLKQIYGLGFWLRMNGDDRLRFGYRFRCICQELGFKFTGEKRNKANLYIPTN